MSTTLVAGTSKGAGVASLRAFLPDLLFGLLVIYNTLRLFRHAMWRDEVQAYMLAAASSTPLDLFARVQYENHPAPSGTCSCGWSRASPPIPSSYR